MFNFHKILYPAIKPNVNLETISTQPHSLYISAIICVFVIPAEAGIQNKPGTYGQNTSYKYRNR